MPLLRIAIIAVGAFLLLTGIFKAWWEVKSWEVLSTLECRPPLIEGSPRIEIRLFLVVAAIGAAVLSSAVVLW